MNTLDPAYNPRKIYAPFSRVSHKGAEWQATYKKGRKELNVGENPAPGSEFWCRPTTLQNPGNKVGRYLSRSKPASHPDRN